MSNSATIQQWVSHKLDAKVNLRLKRLAEAQDVAKVAVMPDVHLAGEVCNGVVVATESQVYPQCIGGDIGCGYLSVELQIPDGLLALGDELLAAIWSGIRKAVPLNKHVDRAGFESDMELSSSSLEKSAVREGRLQLGTLGRGNHFVELQRDESGAFSLLIHSGSRAMGPLISAWHLKDADVDQCSGLKFLDARTDAGKAFLNDLQWARQYAHTNRLEMLGSIEKNAFFELGITVDRDSLIHLDHNHVQREVHAGSHLWVHRKGAQGLKLDQASVIPGSMGTTTYVVEGRANCEALNSCSHGAGRLMSRKEAANRLSVKRLRQEMSKVWYNRRRVKMLLDEAPSAYKDIRKVMKAQKELVRIVGRREPVLNFKGK